MKFFRIFRVKEILFKRTWFRYETYYWFKSFFQKRKIFSG